MSNPIDLNTVDWRLPNIFPKAYWTSESNPYIMFPYYTTTLNNITNINSVISSDTSTFNFFYNKNNKTLNSTIYTAGKSSAVTLSIIFNDGYNTTLTRSVNISTSKNNLGVDNIWFTSPKPTTIKSNISTIPDTIDFYNYTNSYRIFNENIYYSDQPNEITNFKSKYLKYTSDNSNITFNGTVATINQYGSYTITITQSTDNDSWTTVTKSFILDYKVVPTFSSTFTVKNFTDINQTITLIPPSSNSSGSFIYSSSDTTVVLINGNQATSLKAGTVTITAIQQATNEYSSKSINTTVSVSIMNTETDKIELSNFYISPSNLLNSIFVIPPPKTYGDGAIIYTSSNTNIITISGNTATMVGVGEAYIIATQASTTLSSGGSINSNTIYIGNVTSSFLNTDKIDYSNTTLRFTNFNPITNILTNWNYFYYSSSNTHQINGTIGSDLYNYFRNLNADVFILYAGPGGNGGIKNGGGGGPGEVILTKISSSNINYDSTISFNIGSNNRTTISYKDLNGTTKTYYAYGGNNGTTNSGGAGGGINRSGNYNNQYNNTLNNSVSFGSGTGGNPNNIGTGTNISFNDSNIFSDGTGTKVIQYGGNGGTSKNTSTNANSGFVMIFYDVLQIYRKYNPTNLTSLTLHNYNKFTNIKLANWIYYVFENNYNTSINFNLFKTNNINNVILITDHNSYLNNLLQTNNINYTILNNKIYLLYVGGGGKGGNNGKNESLYNGGGGGGGGGGQIYKQTINLIDYIKPSQTYGFNLQIGNTSNSTTCNLYNNTNNSTNLTNFPSALCGKTGNNGQDASPTKGANGGYGADGYDADSSKGLIGSAPGGGGGKSGDTKNPGYQGSYGNDTQVYIDGESSYSRCGLYVSLDENINSPNNFVTGWSGRGNSNGNNGYSGDNGYVVIYFQVTTIS